MEKFDVTTSMPDAIAPAHAAMSARALTHPPNVAVMLGHVLAHVDGQRDAALIGFGRGAATAIG
ncbi:MAG: hypothetical protein M9905_17930 [Rhizobiaceae bacterium]|nr:hypothetical protein [Rhizobiaceae bacterium]